MLDDFAVLVESEDVHRAAAGRSLTGRSEGLNKDEVALGYRPWKLGGLVSGNGFDPGQCGDKCVLAVSERGVVLGVGRTDQLVGSPRRLCLR